MKQFMSRRPRVKFITEKSISKITIQLPICKVAITQFLTCCCLTSRPVPQKHFLGFTN